MLNDYRSKVSVCAKSFLGNDDWFVAILIVLVAVVSFGLGRASYKPDNRQTSGIAPATVVESLIPTLHTDTSTTTEPIAPETTPNAYVGSKNGTKYHLPWCPGAKQMKEENKIWFQTKEKAEAAGYTPAANCKGI